jgi:hypothetical protein
VRACVHRGECMCVYMSACICTVFLKKYHRIGADIIDLFFLEEASTIIGWDT